MVKKLTFLTLVSVFLIVLPNWHEVQAAGYIKSASASHYFGAGTITPTETDVYNVAIDVAQSVKYKMGSEPAKVVIMLTNSGFPAKVVEAIKNIFGAGTFVAGVATGSAKYQPLSIDYFPPPESKELVIIGIGGTAITSITQADDGAKYGSGGNDPNIVAGAKDMALKLTPNPLKKNLLLILGPGHWDNNTYILQGIKQAWGDPLPAYLNVFGMGAADGYAASIVNGAVKGSTINAILITGDFKISSRGVGEGFGGDPVTVSKNLLNQVKTELGGNADILFNVPGHPQTETGYTGIDPFIMYQNMRQSVIDVFGNVTLVGHHASSETGQKLTNSPVEAVKYTFYAVGIKATGVSPSGFPSPTPTNSPLPSVSPSIVPSVSPCLVPSSDGNNDGKTNLIDFGKWRMKLGQSIGCPLNGDFDANGKVEIADFMYWVTRYP